VRPQVVERGPQHPGCERGARLSHTATILPVPALWLRVDRFDGWL
jgi:hypothetical protein